MWILWNSKRCPILKILWNCKRRQREGSHKRRRFSESVGWLQRFLCLTLSTASTDLILLTVTLSFCDTLNCDTLILWHSTQLNSTGTLSTVSADLTQLWHSQLWLWLILWYSTQLNSFSTATISTAPTDLTRCILWSGCAVCINAMRASSLTNDKARTESFWNYHTIK